MKDALAGPLSDGAGHVVIDLRAVTFLDSTAIGTLVAADRRARGEGRRLSAIVGGPASRTPLEVTASPASST